MEYPVYSHFVDQNKRVLSGSLTSRHSTYFVELERVFPSSSSWEGERGPLPLNPVRLATGPRPEPLPREDVSRLTNH